MTQPIPFTPFDAVTFPLEAGTTLIEASAGTGKTYSIAALYLRLVLEEALPVQAILAVTYTTAATKELRERIRSRLHAAWVDLRRGASEDAIVAKYLAAHADPKPGERLLNLAVQSFDDARIFTIHGFCQRVLQERAFESGARYGAELTPDARPLLEEVAADFWRIRFHEAPALVAALAVARGESPEAWVELLEQTRNHPDLVLRPSPEACVASVLAEQLGETFEALRQAWLSEGSCLEAVLQADKTLRPAELKRRIAALPVLARLGAEPDGELIAALGDFTSTAIAAAAGKNKTPLSHPFFARCDALFALADAFFNQLTHEALAYAAEEIPARKLRRGILTYDDLLTQVHAALTGPRGAALARAVGGGYQAALIDEFQDTDPLQYAIFERFFGGGAHRLFFIGDPKQAIYGFRGADIFTYLKAARAARRRATLAVNWRSDEALLAGFNALFARREDGAPFVVEQIQYYPVHSNKPEIPPGTPPALEVRYLPSDAEKGFAQEAAMHALAAAAARDVAQLHVSGGGEWQWGDLAILVRTHRQAEAVYEALARRGLRGVMHTEASVFQSPEAAEMRLLLEAALEPGLRARLHAALVTPFGGLNGNELAELSPEDHQRWVERFAGLGTLWRDAGFAVMFRRLLAGGDLYRRVMEAARGERRLTNYLHLAELLHDVETAGGFTPEALVDWLAQQRVNPREAAEAAQLRLESDGDAVQIVTVHQSKGLEYPVVLCPFLWCPADTPRRKRVQFHDAEGRLTFDLRGKDGADPEDIEAHGREALAEEVRLLYVAVTRAEHRCIIYTGDIQQPGVSALGHVLGDGIREGARALAASCPEHVALTMIEPEEGPHISPFGAPEEKPVCAARVFPGMIRTPAFLTSFTGLTAGTGGELPERDALPAALPAAGDEAEPVAGIFQFEKGARAGEFLHDVLENLDFRHPEQIAPLVEARLGAYGLKGSPHSGAVVQKLTELLEVELAPGLTLSRIGLDDRLTEAEFSARLPSLKPEDLRAVFADFASPVIDPAALGALRFTPVEGFLRGFVDLFFRHEGRYYIADWKSNWLGERPSDYDAPGVEAAMRAHHYALQAHLYVLAADRFLSARLPGYDYERDFGGVFYVFLRGVERGNPERGICRMRPPLALVEKLRRLSQTR